MLLDKRTPVTYILNKVKFEIVYVSAVSLTLIYITEEYQHLIPDMPLTIPAFIGTALSILLSFKLNQSYDRWWEARKVWGAIVNDSRSLVIQLLTFTEKKGAEEIVKKIAFRQIAWAYSLGQTLRKQDPLANTEELIHPDDQAFISRHTNKPLAILLRHGLDVKELKENGYMDNFSRLQIDDTLTRLCDSQGKAERIKSTVFPVTYRIFLHMIIYVFVVTLSIALKNVSGYFELPLLLIISSTFFLLERSSTHMQDPFENKPTDTAVTAIARTIDINLRQLVNDPNVPEPLKPEDFYLL